MKPNQIKFRAKTIDTNQWVYGYYIRFETRQICPTNDKLDDDEVLHLIANESFADWNMPRQMNFTKVVECSVGQFTSMVDKYGKDIYEGDIVEYGDFDSVGTGYIDWDEHRASYIIINSEDGEEYLLGRYYADDLEIIDNMFDRLNYYKGE